MTTPKSESSKSFHRSFRCCFIELQNTLGN